MNKTNRINLVAAAVSAALMGVTFMGTPASAEPQQECNVTNYGGECRWDSPARGAETHGEFNVPDGVTSVEFEVLGATTGCRFYENEPLPRCAAGDSVKGSMEVKPGDRFDVTARTGLPFNDGSSDLTVSGAAQPLVHAAGGGSHSSSYGPEGAAVEKRDSHSPGSGTVIIRW
ncbi:hypothetical protein [Streptomyces sp. NPDC008121]|uniref:hypothetical protein n=1 Tax=Streptomyces sp. NPDC008121 TaxID=3364809 RepID=UPI0036EF8477